MRHTRHVQKALHEESRPEHTLFVITTDGYENASVHYTYQKVKKTVAKRKEEDGWQFIFLGVDIDAIGEAAKIGIDADMAAPYMHDDEGISVCYGAMADAMSAVRQGAVLEGSVLAAPRADYKRRHKR